MVNITSQKEADLSASEISTIIELAFTKLKRAEKAQVVCEEIIKLGRNGDFGKSCSIMILQRHLNIGPHDDVLECLNSQFATEE